MVKKDMIDLVAKELGLTKIAAEKTIHTVLDSIVDGALADGRAMYGKHRFIKKVRPARNGRNPKTGESLQIPEATTVVYRMSKQQA